jgi:glycosyltransferase involved in cell wall biosynthesis
MQTYHLHKGTSAIIPAYNVETKMLEAAVNSALEQSKPVREVIVVDDGSERPVDLLGFADSRLRIVRQNNGGLASARNKGIQEATSEFIAFLDADDMWAPRKIECQELCLEKNLDVVACFTRCVSAPGFYGFGPYPSKHVTEQAFIANLWSSQFFPPSSTMVRTDALRKIGGYRQGLLNGEDLELLMRLLQIGKIEQVEEELTYYRTHPAQITSDAYRKFSGGREARKIVISQCADVLRRAGLQECDFWVAHRDEILLVYYRRNFHAARRLLWEYWLEHPSDIEILLKMFVSYLPRELVAKARGRIPLLAACLTIASQKHS